MLGTMIAIGNGIALDEREIDESFVRASGPGGQNVNKLSTSVQLRFDVRRSPSLPVEVRDRLARLAGRRLTGDGVLVIVARCRRTQAANREDALARLIELIRRAAHAHGRVKRPGQVSPPGRAGFRRRAGAPP